MPSAKTPRPSSSVLGSGYRLTARILNGCHAVTGDHKTSHSPSPPKLQK